MTRARSAIITVALLLSGPATARAEFITVDFDAILGSSSTRYPLPLPGLPAGSPVNERFLELEVHGFGLAGDRPADPLFVQNSIWGSIFNGYPSNTTAVLHVPGSGLAIHANDGNPFSLLAMDLGAAPAGAGGARSILFQGYRAGGAVGSFDVALNEGAFLTTDLARLGLVDSVRVSGFTDGESAAFVADNLSIHRVTEPTTLLLTAVGAVVLVRRQRKARRALEVWQAKKGSTSDLQSSAQQTS